MLTISLEERQTKSFGMNLLLHANLHCAMKISKPIAKRSRLVYDLRLICDFDQICRYMQMQVRKACVSRHETEWVFQSMLPTHLSISNYWKYVYSRFNICRTRKVLLALWKYVTNFCGANAMCLAPWWNQDVCSVPGKGANFNSYVSQCWTIMHLARRRFNLE